jgi:hypothetical protein
MCRYLVFLLLSQAAFAASIGGVVKDAPGVPANGAAVELREVPGTGSPKNARTDAPGGFRFNNLSGTHYRVRVTQAGFQAFESDVNIEGGKDAALEIMLAVAEARESVVVAGMRRMTVDAVYQALRGSPIEDVYAVENLVLQRDEGVLTLKKGTIGFTAPQMGRDTVAVFSGDDGDFAFDPPISVEKKHLKNLTDQEQVHEVFDRAFIEGVVDAERGGRSIRDDRAGVCRLRRADHAVGADPDRGEYDE